MRKDNNKHITLGECLVELTKLEVEACRKEITDLKREDANKRREIYSLMSKHLSKVKGFKIGL